MPLTIKGRYSLACMCSPRRPTLVSPQVTMRLTIKAGYDLLAADRGGTSDPYVIWHLGAESGRVR